jgi:transposase-like protein
MADVLGHERFQDEQAAYDWVEAQLWPDGAVCPRCGGLNRNTKLKGKSTRIGVYKCKDCRKPFTVKIGTIFEDSHIPMRLWLQAIALLTASKKGIGSNQLHRMMGITLKSAWFMSHRIREAMRVGGLSPMGGGGIVEMDETVQGRTSTAPPLKELKSSKYGGWAHRNVVLSLVERGGGVRSFHEYVRYEEGREPIHTNTVEGYFSVFKRGMRGVYQHCSERHLHRYLAEFDFRYSNRIRLGVDDGERATRALVGVKGKRLTYRTPRRPGGRGPNDPGTATPVS